MYSRLIAPFWNFQAGIHYSPKSDPTREFGVHRVQCLTLYFHEIEAAAFISREGAMSAFHGCARSDKPPTAPAKIWKYSSFVTGVGCGFEIKANIVSDQNQRSI